MTEVELLLAPAQPWRDVLVSFPNFMDAVRFSHAVAADDGIIKRLVSTHQWESAPYLREPLGDVIRDGEAAVLLMVAAGSEAAATRLARRPRRRNHAERRCACARGGAPAACRSMNAPGATRRCTPSARTDDQLPAGSVSAHRIVESVERCGGCSGRSCRSTWSSSATTARWLRTARSFGRSPPSNGWTRSSRRTRRGHSHRQPARVHRGGGFPPQAGAGDQMSFKRSVDPLGLLNPARWGPWRPLLAEGCGLSTGPRFARVRHRKEAIHEEAHFGGSRRTGARAFSPRHSRRRRRPTSSSHSTGPGRGRAPSR